MSNVFTQLLARETRLLFRRPAELANPLVFFAIVTALFPLAVGPESQLLQTLSPGLLWVAALLAVLLSLVLAIALNPGRLFFLAIIVPAILLLFVIYGLFSRWAHARTASPAVAAIANALAFAWFIALSFPLVG